MESDKKKITYHFPKAKFKNEFFFESSSEKALTNVRASVILLR